MNNEDDKKPCIDEGASKDGSAATSLTDPEPPIAGSVSSNDTATRRRILTTHRKTLERIRGDAIQTRRHKVPDSQQRRHVRHSVRKAVDSMAARPRRSGYEWLEMFLPCSSWLKTYQWRSDLIKDLIAGLTVGVMVVPQSMSYAKLAGLPVEYGLYSALVPVYAYALWGTSRQLAVGPVALISLLLSTGLTHALGSMGMTRENTPGYQEIYNQMAIQTSFLVGVTYVVLGLLRLGFITIFLSHAVISGFTTGAAVIIGLSQVKYIFGYDFPKSDMFHKIIQHIVEEISNFNYKTFLVGTISILVLVVMKNIGKSYPKFKWVRAAGPLTVCVVSILLNLIFDLEGKGIPVVGSIPRGLPTFTVNQWFPIENMDKLMVTVISITIVGFMESIAIGKQLASKHKYEIDSSTELIGLGMANFCGAIVHSYPVTGSFSRSAVNNESGAQSGISGIVTATMVGFVLLFLTPVFEKMPLAVLAAIVISGVLGLLDYEEAMYLWKVHRFDFGVWVIACLGTMFLGVEIGLAIAVCVSLLLVTYESAYPHTAVLGRLPGTSVYRNVKQYPEAESYDGIVMIRIDAPIYFANTQNVREKINKYEQRATDRLAERNGSVKYIVLEMSPVSHIDTSALHILDDMNKNYKHRGIQLCMCNPGCKVMEKLVKSGLADEIGRDYLFACIADCVSWCLDEMDNHEVSLHDDPERLKDHNLLLEDDEELGGTRDLEGGSHTSGSVMIFAPENVELELREETEIAAAASSMVALVTSLGSGQL